MSVEFIGYVGHFNSSETTKREGPAIDLDHIEAVAKAQEYVGFDRVLVAFNPTSTQLLTSGGDGLLKVWGLPRESTT